MKKLALMMALALTVASVNTFAADGGKCKAGKNCCKKMKSASAATKAKCAKACAEKAKKAA